MTEVALHERRLTVIEIRLQQAEADISGLQEAAAEVRRAAWRLLRGVIGLLSAFALDQGLNGGAFAGALRTLLNL